jgi:hypothetical protein
LPSGETSQLSASASPTSVVPGLNSTSRLKIVLAAASMVESAMPMAGLKVSGLASEQ